MFLKILNIFSMQNKCKASFKLLVLDLWSGKRKPKKREMMQNFTFKLSEGILCVKNDRLNSIRHCCGVYNNK